MASSCTGLTEVQSNVGPIMGASYGDGEANKRQGDTTDRPALTGLS